MKPLCRALAVSESGAYAWRKREPSQRQRENEQLTEQIRQVFQQGRQVSGSPGVPADRRARGIAWGKHPVARLMRQAGVHASCKRRRRLSPTDSRDSDPLAPNLRARDFTAPAPQRKWLTARTAIWTAQGWLYLAVVLDGSSRLSVGWALAPQREESLLEAALWMALGRRKPLDDLVHHCERGRKSHQSGLSKGACAVSPAGEHEREGQLLR